MEGEAMSYTQPEHEVIAEDHPIPTLYRVKQGAVAVVTLAAAAVLIQPVQADASTVAAGGHVILNRHRVVQSSDLPRCRVEDSSNDGQPCERNFGARPAVNGRGLAYWNDGRNRSHYVWSSTPHRKGYRWVSRELADALAEGGEPANADTRNWQACIVRFGGTTVVRCPDGTRLTS